MQRKLNYIHPPEQTKSSFFFKARKLHTFPGSTSGEQYTIYLDPCVSRNLSDILQSLSEVLHMLWEGYQTPSKWAWGGEIPASEASVNMLAKQPSQALRTWFCEEKIRFGWVENQNTLRKGRGSASFWANGVAKNHSDSSALWPTALFAIYASFIFKMCMIWNHWRGLVVLLLL